MFAFRKIWRALFSYNTRFEIRPFALLPLNSKKSLGQNFQRQRTCLLIKEIILLANNLQKKINPVHANVPFLYPLKTQKTFGFSDVLGGIKMGH